MRFQTSQSFVTLFSKAGLFPTPVPGDTLRFHSKLLEMQLTPESGPHQLDHCPSSFRNLLPPSGPSTAAAAPAPGCFSSVVAAPAQVDGAPPALRRLTQHQWLLTLELVGHRHEDGLHVVTVSTAADSRTLVAAAAAWLLSRRLEQRHGVAVGELLRQVAAHLHRVVEVTLVAHQDAGHLAAQGVLLALLDPRRQAAETGRVGHVVHEDHGVNVAVVVLHHGLPETLLTSRVPQLDLQVRRLASHYSGTSNPQVLNSEHLALGHIFVQKYTFLLHKLFWSAETSGGHSLAF